MKSLIKPGKKREDLPDSKDKPKPQETTNVSTNPTKTTKDPVNDVELALTKLTDEFGKLFTRDELLQEYEKSQNNLTTTIQTLVVKKEEKLTTKNKSLFQKINEVKPQAVNTVYRSNEQSVFATTLKKIEETKHNSNPLKIKVPKSLLAKVIENFTLPSPDAQVRSKRL